MGGESHCGGRGPFIFTFLSKLCWSTTFCKVPYNSLIFLSVLCAVRIMAALALGAIGGMGMPI